MKIILALFFAAALGVAVIIGARISSTPVITAGSENRLPPTPGIDTPEIRAAVRQLMEESIPSPGTLRIVSITSAPTERDFDSLQGKALAVETDSQNLQGALVRTGWIVFVRFRGRDASHGFRAREMRLVGGVNPWGGQRSETTFFAR